MILDFVGDNRECKSDVGAQVALMLDLVLDNLFFFERFATWHTDKTAICVELCGSFETALLGMLGGLGMRKGTNTIPAPCGEVVDLVV